MREEVRGVRERERERERQAGGQTGITDLKAPEMVCWLIDCTLATSPVHMESVEHRK